MSELIYIQMEDGLRRVSATRIIHPIHHMYHCHFNDGYENIFFTDPESGNWVEQDIGYTALSAQLGSRFSRLDDEPVRQRKLTWYRCDSIDSRVQFGFFPFMISTFPAFEIYAPNKRFLFTIVQLNDITWQVFRITGPGAWQGGNKIVHMLPGVLENFLPGNCTL